MEHVSERGILPPASYRGKYYAFNKVISIHQFFCYHSADEALESRIKNQDPYEQDLGCSFFFSFQMIKTVNWMNGKHSLNNQSSSLKRIMLIIRETHLRLIMQSFFHVLGSNKIASVVNQLASPTLPEVILPTLCLCSTLPCCFYERHAFNHPLQSTASIKHFASLPTSVQGLANHFLSFIDLCTLHNDSSVTCVSE